VAYWASTSRAVNTNPRPGGVKPVSPVVAYHVCYNPGEAEAELLCLDQRFIVRNSFVPTGLFSAERLSDRQRWDHRYATLEPGRRTEPVPFLVDCLRQLPARGYALDVAAGAGRNSVALAEHGLSVDAVDLAWRGLQRAVALARQRGVRINPIVLDLSRGWLPRRRYDVVVSTFFLLRDLIPAIKAVLKPGGWLVFETFTRAQLDITKQCARDQSYLLKSDELRQLFSDFVILHYWEGVEENRATARLLARKPSPGEA
jgi:tellurite methyltransferase